MSGKRGGHPLFLTHGRRRGKGRGGANWNGRDAGRKNEPLLSPSRSPRKCSLGEGERPVSILIVRRFATHRLRDSSLRYEIVCAVVKFPAPGVRSGGFWSVNHGPQAAKLANPVHLVNQCRLLPPFFPRRLEHTACITRRRVGGGRFEGRAQQPMMLQSLHELVRMHDDV
jgi:hypothetical protein